MSLKVYVKVFSFADRQFYFFFGFFITHAFARILFVIALINTNLSRVYHRFSAHHHHHIMDFKSHCIILSPSLSYAVENFSRKTFKSHYAMSKKKIF